MLKFLFTVNCEWELNVSVKKKKKKTFQICHLMWIFQRDADGQKMKEAVVGFVWFSETTVA